MHDTAIGTASVILCQNIVQNSNAKSNNSEKKFQNEILKWIWYHA